MLEDSVRLSFSPRRPIRTPLPTCWLLRIAHHCWWPSWWPLRGDVGNDHLDPLDKKIVGLPSGYLKLAKRQHLGGFLSLQQGTRRLSPSSLKLEIVCVAIWLTLTTTPFHWPPVSVSAHTLTLALPHLWRTSCSFLSEHQAACSPYHSVDMDKREFLTTSSMWHTAVLFLDLARGNLWQGQGSVTLTPRKQTCREKLRAQAAILGHSFAKFTQEKVRDHA